MERKRNGLVSIGEVFSGLGGTVKKALESPPQALHRFTRFDQVDQRSGCGSRLHGMAEGDL